MIELIFVPMKNIHWKNNLKFQLKMIELIFYKNKHPLILNGQINEDGPVIFENIYW